MANIFSISLTSLFMCISPIKIKNPNRGLSFPVGSVNRFKDCTSAYINVPCGHCLECVNAHKMKIAQRAQIQSKYCATYFLTFTYNNEHLPSIDVNGYNIKYADLSDVQKMLKHLRRHFPLPFKYLCVSERGAKGGRPHFHMLIFIEKEYVPTYLDQLNVESQLRDLCLSLWRFNVGSDKSPIYEPLCTYVEKFRYGRLNKTFDCHLVLPSVTSSGSTEVVYYVTKYLLKRVGYSDALYHALQLNLEPDEFRRVWNIVKDRCVYSKDFGLRSRPEVSEYLRFSLDSSLSDKNILWPSFVDCDSGRLVPMCKFYQDVSVTYDDAMEFYKRRQSRQEFDGVDTLVVSDRELAQLLDVEQHGKFDRDLNDIMSEFDNSDFLFD